MILFSDLPSFHAKSSFLKEKKRREREREKGRNEWEFEERGRLPSSVKKVSSQELIKRENFRVENSCQKLSSSYFSFLFSILHSSLPLSLSLCLSLRLIPFFFLRKRGSLFLSLPFDYLSSYRLLNENESVFRYEVKRERSLTNIREREKKRKKHVK